MILAVCNSSQYELSAYRTVKDILNERGIDIVSFKQDCCLDGEYLQFSNENGIESYELTIDGKTYDANEFDTIWYIKPQLPKALLSYKPESHAIFIRKQFYAMREALWTLFRHKNWLNDPWKMCLAENKIYQLHIANKIGFKIPNTLISSNPKEIKDFYLKNKRTIIKTLDVGPILNHVLYTNEITENDMDKISQAIFSPSIYQELVEKVYDLRVTVVGKDIFPVKIHSQKNKSTLVDWRVPLKDNDIVMEPCQTPASLNELILNLMDTLSLRFGCIDMILTTNNEFVFLEINPNGQWYFVQLKTEYNIARSIANLLTVSS